MTDTQKFEDDRSVLRWGGLAGMVGGVLFILVFAIVGVFVGGDPTEIEGEVARFPDIRAWRTLENGLYLVVLILWTTHFLALYRALRQADPAPALFGSVVGILGLAVLAAGAVPHAATVPISDLYHAPGASPENQATLVLVWQATQGLFNALLVTGLVMAPLGLIGICVAMLRAPGFGRGYGWAGLALGVIGAGAAVALLIDPLSYIAVVVVFALILFHLVVGWRVYRLSSV